jgi:hypothetical protein
MSLFNAIHTAIHLFESKNYTLPTVIFITSQFEESLRAEAKDILRINPVYNNTEFVDKTILYIMGIPVIVIKNLDNFKNRYITYSSEEYKQEHPEEFFELSILPDFNLMTMKQSRAGK